MNPAKYSHPPSPLDIIRQTGIFPLFSRWSVGQFCSTAAEVVIRSLSCLISTQYKRSHLRSDRVRAYLSEKTNPDFNG